MEFTLHWLMQLARIQIERFEIAWDNKLEWENSIIFKQKITTLNGNSYPPYYYRASLLFCLYLSFKLSVEGEEIKLMLCWILNILQLSFPFYFTFPLLFERIEDKMCRGAKSSN